MPTKVANSYSVVGNIVTINFDQAHGMSQGTYFSVRAINSNVNGQYIVSSVNNSTSVSYIVPSAPDTPLTSTNGYIIYTTINDQGKPGYIYDEPTDSWYQISGKVNTNGNYTWTGTHLHEAPVTMKDLVILKNISASVSSSPVGGGYLFVENGALKFKGGNGTITTVAPA